MRLTVIGSADAFNSAGRNHSCYWLEGAAQGPLMVDFGATALHALKQQGKDPRDIAGIAITHLHGDHVGGFPYLLIDGMFNLVRRRALSVLGPVGTAAKIAEFFRTAYGPLADWELPFELTTRELAPGGEMPLVGARVQGFAANHMDLPEQPLCLRVAAPDGKVVAFSGDTAMCDGLFEAADGADLLVAECTALRQPAGRHCTWDEWREALGRVNARRVLLTHLGEDVRAAVPELLATRPPGPELGFAEDGLVVDV